MHILIHTANQAAFELKGCIAQVIVHACPGIGIHSKNAMYQLLNIVEKYFHMKYRVEIFLYNISKQIFNEKIR